MEKVNWIPLIKQTYSEEVKPVNWKNYADVTKAAAIATIAIFAGLVVLHGASEKKTV